MIINKYILYIYSIHGKYYLKYITTFVKKLRTLMKLKIENSPKYRQNRKFDKILTKSR